MIDARDIKKMVSHIVRRQRGATDREPIDPAREWLLGIMAAFVLVIIGGLVSYQVYRSSSHFVADIPPASTAIPYNTVITNEALTWYRERASAYQAIKGEARLEEAVMPVTPTEIPVSDADTEPMAEPDTLVVPDTATTTSPVPADATTSGQEIPQLEG